MATKPRGPASWRRTVTARALMEARGCLRDWDDGRQSARELKAVAETIIAPEYQGRVLIELLQNAHDAHPSRARDGRVEILLDEDEGEHGVLYVANGGNPLRKKDFTALCSIGLSGKRPDEGIGHKGVGFKSVLQLTEAPELYSVLRAGSRTFDGYCFRFALPGDFPWLADQVAPGRDGLAEHLEENLFRLKVPIPVDEVPEAAQRYGRREFVTVVRLPLRSPEAAKSARTQLGELMDDEAPFELFLERLKRVTLGRRAAGRTERKHYDRTVKTLHRLQGITVQEITLPRRRMNLIMVRAKVDEGLARAAIATSVDEGTLRPDWTVWEKKAEVSVAVPVGDPLDRGRLYTFLPMGEQISAPLNGLVNAPFFAELNRRSFSESLPWNALLLDTLALACVRTALLAEEGRLTLPAGALTDLMCWDPTRTDRLEAAFDGLGEELDGVPFMPVLAPAGGRTSFNRAYLWTRPETAQVLTPEAIAAAGVEDLIDPGLHPVRLRRLIALADARRLSITPPPELVATWSQSLAAHSLSGPFDPGWWADYYHDLSVCFPDTSILTGKEIILSSAMTLAPAGADGVFLDRGGDTASVLPALPAELADHVLFVHESLDWTGRRAKRRTAARRWLQNEHLVQEYGGEAVLRVVTTAMGADGVDDNLRLQCFQYACAVSNALERGGRRTPPLPDLLVPTRGGWLAASRAMFGRGWPGDRRSVDETLTRFLEGTQHIPVLEVTGGRLLKTPEEICAESDLRPEAVLSFLERHGVRHGLRPRYEVFTGGVRGEGLNHPSWFAGLWHRDTTPDFGPQWRATARRWPNRRPVAHSTVLYRPTRRGLPVLPGQYAYAQLDDESRRLYAELIVHGLATWPDSDLEMRFVRSVSDSRGTPWPTPLAAFLAQAPWIPQTPARGGNATFAPAATAWWWHGQETPPDYLTVVPAAFRRRHSARVIDRLRLLSIRAWDDPRTAPDRLRELPALVEERAELRQEAYRHVLSRAYEQAWSQVLPSTGESLSLAVNPPDRLLVLREGVLGTLHRGTDETVYVPDPPGAQNQRLLERVPVALLPIGDRALGLRVQAHLAERTGFEARLASEAETDIHVGVLPLRETPRQSLTAYAGPWLRTFVAAVVDLDEEVVSRPDAVPVPEALRRLQACEFTVAREAVVWIAGHRVDESGVDRALLQQDPERPCLVILHTQEPTPWRVLLNAATALGALVGAPYLGKNLRAALIELRDRCPDTEEIDDERIAAALDVPLRRLQLVLAHRASERSGSALLVPLLACVDIDLAEELQRSLESFHDRAELSGWLAHRLGPPRADLLLRLLDDDDRQRQLAELSVSLTDANQAWRALGLPVVDNQSRHTRQFEAWLQRNRSALIERIRDAYAGVHRAGRSLAGYLGLRSLPDLAPDPEWHTTLWDLPPDLLQAHADAWAAARLPAPNGRRIPLRPLEEVREASIGAVHRALPRLRVLMDEWTLRTGAGAAPFLPGAGDLVQELDAEGLLDFVPLTSPGLVNWLDEHGYWPAGMPATDRRGELGLDQPPVSVPGPRSSSGSSPDSGQGGPASDLLLNGKRLPTRPDELREFARAVAGDVTAEQLATPVHPTGASAPVMAKARNASGSGTSGGGGGSYRAPSSDKDKNTAIGLAGETVVGAWLRQQFGVPEESSWKSSLRSHVIAGGPGDDRLGYDFRVHDGDRTYLYEVKASIGSSCEIILGDSETRCASHLGPNETYVIVYVSDVLDRARRRITPLPNPFGAPGLAGYELVSTRMRLRFTLPPDTP
ncbi:ATP-binding protein [Streptomyces cyaneofuscatus]|uniref:ATP-binding protein n=1 Tax=Streptomyces cyaneofuscatus TaxID=66883 RepID=UPI0034131F31